MFSSSKPCLLRISALCWKCSQCGALFFCENNSIFHLLGLFDRHTRRAHPEPQREQGASRGTGKRET